MKPLSTQARETIGHWSLAFLLAFAATGTFAAEPSGPEQWTFGADVYLWGAGIGGTTTSGGDIDITFSDLIDNLDLAVMGFATANKGKWTLMADVIYLNVSEDNSGALSIPLGSGVEVSDKVNVNVKLKGWIPTFSVQYNLIDNDKGAVRLLGGARYLWLDADIKLTIDDPLGTRTAKLSKSGGNWDAIIGVKGRVNLAGRWYLPYYADIGTGDSELTWQVFGGVGYQFDKVDALLGYRYMAWQFNNNDTFDDLNLSGPFAGIRFAF